MTAWAVLKRHTGTTDRRPEWDGYSVLGTYESGESYYIYGPTAAQDLGPRYGAGEYLLLDDDSERFKRLTIGERQDFYEVKPEDEMPDSIGANADSLMRDDLAPGLSEGDLTAAEVMARDA